MRTRLLVAVAVVVGAAALTTVASADGRSQVRLVLGPRAIALYHSASVRISRLRARSAEVSLVGAIDRTGLAYHWTPYRWQALRTRDGVWRGLLPAPPLYGIYRIRLRIDNGRSFLSSPRWLLRVFPHGTVARPSFSTAAAAVRHFVARLPGHETLVASRRWPLAKFDHRDPRLNRQFVIAYAPRGDHNAGSRLGLFVTTVRDGYDGGWRILQATTKPSD